MASLLIDCLAEVGILVTSDRLIISRVATPVFYQISAKRELIKNKAELVDINKFFDELINKGLVGNLSEVTNTSDRLLVQPY